MAGRTRNSSDPEEGGELRSADPEEGGEIANRRKSDVDAGFMRRIRLFFSRIFR